MGRGQGREASGDAVSVVGAMDDRLRRKNDQWLSRSEPVRVLILDPLPMWITALDELVSANGMHVVGTSTEVGEAVRQVVDLQPDLLLCGIDTADGAIDVTVVRESRKLAPEIKVLVLSQRSDRATIEAAFAAGAQVHALKNMNPSDLLAAIRQVFKQSIFIADQWNRNGHPLFASGEGIPELTPREREILQLVADGYTNRAMAAMLWVTDQTIKFHLSNIYKKLHVANRTEAARWAQVNGLLTDAETRHNVNDRVA